MFIYKRTYIHVVLVLFICQIASSQFDVNYDPKQQPIDEIQYFKPVEHDLFVGDCMPFSHDGTLYMYWLIDKGHHSALDGYGAHQWVLSTSDNLINWKHYPIALGLDEEWEKSICTGSVIYAEESFYAFFATRSVRDGQRHEEMSFAVSDDGKDFEKLQPNPFFTAPEGYESGHFRDPKAIEDDDGYHLFISAYQSDPEMIGFGGTLAHLFSDDLRNWEVKEPVLTGQRHTPECPDYFIWNEWYYMTFSNAGATYYVKSRQPYGPWEYPRFQAFKEPWANVAKTAPIANGRRISAAWIPVRKDHKDDGKKLFGGNMVLREVIQHEDGTLGTKFPSEVIPKTSIAKDLNIKLTSHSSGNLDQMRIEAPNGIGAAKILDVPADCRIRLEIEPLGTNEEYGLQLRTNDKADGGYRLNFSSNHQRVELGNVFIESVEGLNNNISLDIIMKGDIIDVSIDNRRCLVNRCHEEKGNQLWFYAKHGIVNFKSIKVYEIKN